jgi:hypothetical protein
MQPISRCAETIMNSQSINPNNQTTYSVVSNGFNGLESIDSAKKLFDLGRTNDGLKMLFEGLSAKRHESSELDWRNYVSSMREHPMLQMMYLCPFTHHAKSRPFGYPGDATLIDYIYGYKRPTLLGAARKIYGFNISSPATRAVRYRRGILAQLVDTTLHEEGEDASILAVACGHLRELDLSCSISQVRPMHFWALDQDPVSLGEVERCFGGYGVSAVKKRIKDLIVGRTRFDDVNLIYAAGLYDYLPTDVARMLTERLFSMLAHGGKLTIANFLPGIYDVGYMEAVMDWWLIYRDEQAMLDLTVNIPSDAILNIRQYHDPDDNITFLEIYKA